MFINSPDRSSHHIHPLEPSIALRVHPYAHGGGFGKATEIIASAFWGAMLQAFEPDRFAQCDSLLSHKRVLNALTARKITLALENSAVVAAFTRMTQGPMTLEWDLWLDRNEPDSLEKAKIEHGNVFVTLFPCTSQFFLRKAHTVITWLTAYLNSLDACGIHDKNLSVCLDIKSPWSIARDINNFVRNLQDRFPIIVRYVGSFSYKQISTIEGPEKILFCHGVWDLKIKMQDFQKKVESGEISQEEYPTRIMLNGADLLHQSNLSTLRAIAKQLQSSNREKETIADQLCQLHESADLSKCRNLLTLRNIADKIHPDYRDAQKRKENSFSQRCEQTDLLDQDHLSELCAIVNQHDLLMGIYVQEPAAETRAVQTLTELVNNRPNLFKLGFALGNSGDGRASKMIEGSGAGVQALILTKNVRLLKKITIVAMVTLIILANIAFVGSIFEIRNPLR